MTLDRAVAPGERLFGEASGKKPLRLFSTSTTADGLAFLTCQPA